MRVENLSDVIQAKILSNPAISDITGFCIDPTKARNGDVFICLSRNIFDAKEALANGAYGVIYDVNFEILDEETAFFKVDDLSVALRQLIRYFSLAKELEFIDISHIQAQIISRLILPKNVVLLDKNLGENFLRIQSLKERSLVFCENLGALNLGLEFERIQNKAINTNFSSLFFCDILSQNLNLVFPAPFVPELVGVSDFFSTKNLSFKVRDFRDFPHFRAIFVNKFFRPVALGSGERAFIIESDESLLERECKFLKQFSPEFTLCLRVNSHFQAVQDVKIKYFSDFDELKKLDFRYALILCEFDNLLSFLSEGYVANSLFDEV